MKIKDKGAFYSVSFDCRDITRLADSWPCSGLKGIVRIDAEFDKRNGDLVDIEPNDLEERGVNGSALLALLEDGQGVANDQLGIS
jgi:hypothetical protein